MFFFDSALTITSGATPDAGSENSNHSSPGIYHSAYAHRRALSTMAEVAQREVIGLLAQHRQRIGASIPLRIASLGCGDGNLDLPLLAHLAPLGPIEYVGVDTNDVSLSVFAQQLEVLRPQARIPLHAVLRCAPVHSFLGTPGTFDVILISHLLYYLPDPTGLLSQCAQHHLTSGGEVIVVHSAHRGIPAVLDSLHDCTAFLTAETITSDGRRAGLNAQMDLHATAFDLTDLLGADITTDHAARQLLSFVLEVDLDTRPADLAPRALAALAAQADTIGDRQILREDIGIMCITHPSVTTRPRVDPLQDYVRIAEAFDWERLLAELPCGDDGVARVLDIGCGTGRWLRELAATYPRLAAGGARQVHYSVLDPTSEALDCIAPVVAALFTPDEMFPTTGERADLTPGRFGLIWSLHALYGVDLADLGEVLKRMHAALHPEGTAYVVLPDAHSFYVRAAPEVLGTDLFRSAEEIHAALDALGLRSHVTEVDYAERIPVSEDLTARHYLWVESIGNSYLPAGPAHDALPPLPDSDWWLSHRVGDEWVLPQHVQIIAIPGGQSAQA